MKQGSASHSKSAVLARTARHETERAWAIGARILAAIRIRGRPVINRLLIIAWSIREFENFRDFLTELDRQTPATGTVVIRTRSGLVIAMRKNVWDARIVREMFQQRPYLRHTSLPSSPVIVDIGAYIGDFSLFAAHELNARVFAYEPTIENLELLNENVLANSMGGRIQVVNKAVGDGDPVTLHVSRNGEEIHVSRYWYEGGEDRTVETVTLVDLFETHHLDKIDLLKVDCEGCEYDIFQSVPGPVFERIGNIVFEYHRFEGSDRKLDALKALLTNNGYRLSIDGLIVSACRK